MNEKNKNLVVRIASALVLLPLVLFLLVKGGYFSAGLMGWAAAVCAWEYYVITQKKLSPIAVVGIALAGLFPLLPVWRPEQLGTIAFWSTAGFFFLAWGYHLVRGPLHEAPVIVGHLVVGLLYGSLGMTALSGLREGTHGFLWVLCALIVTWLNDTAAYFTGRAFGRHKLYPQVSPHKTWEGFFGGVAGSVGGLFAAKYLFFSELSVLDCLVVGLAGGVLGPAGDLCESMVKRAYDVKDSGRIIPGHGGLLDRIDALLFNAPMVYVYAHFIRSALG
ncbi:MAG: phosphatidate cytidylyltransferase [Myxococcota bacterium]